VASPRSQHTRARSWRPIEAAEITYLEALGAHLAAVRRDHGLTQAALAEAAELSTSGIRRIEAGTRRTRRSTLDRMAAARSYGQLWPSGYWDWIVSIGSYPTWPAERREAARPGGLSALSYAYRR
jgi:transcriptional regulator with XRE-family HTH domain